MDARLVESISRIEYLEKYGGLRSELDSLPVPEDGKNCHEECSYQRVNDDLVVPVNLQDSKRPKDLYTVCKACEKAKVIIGTQCAHYYLNEDATVSLDPRQTCTRSR
eukprot:scaffold339249_cov30-Attheya_sp.AAC.1